MRLAFRMAQLAGYSLAIAGLLRVGYVAYRIACADVALYGDTADEVRHSVMITPGDSECWQRLARLLDEQRSPKGEVYLALRQSIALQPRDSRVLLMIASTSESVGNVSEAERYLLQAAHFDRTFNPRWALVSFYSRNRDNSFWIWAREAASTACDERIVDLFKLSLSKDGKTIFDRAVPLRPDVQAQYLSFLLTENLVDEAGRPAQWLKEHATQKEAPALLAYCDRLLEAKQVAASLSVWNGLAGRALIDHPQLMPESGSTITNGDFAVELSQRGFDWRPAGADGVTVSRGDGLRHHLLAKTTREMRDLEPDGPRAARQVVSVRI
jgi:hypothetical protein